MRQHLTPLAGSVALALMLSGCPGGNAPAAPTTEVQGAMPAAFSDVTGVVSGPGWLVSAGSGAYRTLAANERPLAGVEVFLADAAGKPVPGFASVRTDSLGRYSFSRLPVGFTWKIVVPVKTATGQTVSLTTLVTTRGAAGQADVSLATTLAAGALTADRTGSMGEVVAEKFAQLVSYLDKALNADEAIDLANGQGLLGKVQSLLATDPTAQALLNELATALADVKVPLPSQPTPTPTPTATSTATPPASTGGGGSSDGVPAPDPVVYPAATLSLGATSYVGLDTGLEITVSDLSAAPSLVARDTLTVRVSSPSEPSGETVTLTETDLTTGVFKGTVPFERLYTDLGTPATIAATGQIAVDAEGATTQEVVTVTYGALSKTATYEEPTSTLTGVVRLGGAPRAYAQVQLNRADGTFVAKTASRADGTYAFHGLAAGTYSVVIAVDGAVAKTVTVVLP